MLFLKSKEDHHGHTHEHSHEKCEHNHDHKHEHKEENKERNHDHKEESKEHNHGLDHEHSHEHGDGKFIRQNRLVIIELSPTIVPFMKHCTNQSQCTDISF